MVRLWNLLTRNCMKHAHTFDDGASPGTTMMGGLGRCAALGHVALVLVWLAVASPVAAADTGADPPADAGVDAETSTSDSGGSADAGDGSDSSAVSDETIELFRPADGDGPTADATVDEIRRHSTAFVEQLTRWRTDWREQAGALTGRAKQLDAVADSLDDEVARGGYSETAARALRREVALTRAKAAVASARADGYTDLDRRSTRAIEGLQVATDPGDDGDDGGESENSAGESKQASLEEAERAAREEMEAARRAEEGERDSQIRDLISRRRQILEDIADLAAEHARRVQQLGTTRSNLADQFSRRQEELETRIDELPREATKKERREAIDPVFEQIRNRLEEARNDFLRVDEQREKTEVSLSGARSRQQTSRRALESTEARFEGVGESDVGQYRIDLASAQLTRDQRRVAMLEDLKTGWERLAELHRRRVQYYRGLLEEILPRVSDMAWSKFFSPWRESNWAFARMGLREAGATAEAIFEERWEALAEAPSKLTTVSFWGWLLGLLWRLALIPVVVFLVRQFRQPVIRRLVDTLLSRGFFRRRADLTIKFVELLASLAWPVAAYGLLRLVGTYLARHFPEAGAAVALVDVGIVYLAAMSVVKVLVLARSVRERLGPFTPAPGLGRWSDEAGHRQRDVVDIVELEQTRATKLVRSSRRVLVYVLMNWFIPGWVAAAIGHNLVWWFTSAAINWGALVILLVELRVWREEIARGFERLASGRMASIAEFVKQHQDRFYGVFLIAGASVVLLAGELIVWARRYIIDAEWSQRVGNFLFRKRIELQQRERDGEDEEAVGTTELKKLPEEYRQQFMQRPLYDESYLVDRGHVDEVWEAVHKWRKRRRKGAMVLAGESGVGKSTLLNQVYRRAEADELPITFVALTDKLVTPEAVRAFVAELFGLPEVPEERDQLVEAVRQQPSKIICLDDCHHMYLRRIGGFRGLARFLDLVNLTDDHHYWVMAFNKFGWRYLERVQEQKHVFGNTVRLQPWSDEELQSLINRRNETVPYTISFQELVVSRSEELSDYYEVVQTANGYFRLLEEFCDGNPSVAMAYWLRNLSVSEDPEVLNVSLFRKPTTEAFSSLTDNHMFALTALAQHGALHPGEISEIINAEPGFCEMAMTHFEQIDMVERESPSGRYALTNLYFRPVVNHLTNSNFLWM